MLGILLAFAWGVGGGTAEAGAAQGGGERIVSFVSTVSLQRDGSVSISETIDYDFGGQQRHGIYRVIPTRFPYDGKTPDGGTYERVTPLEEISVSSPTAGTPTYVDVSEDQGVTKLRIGDADTTISGRHTYVIRYRLRGVTNGFSDHDELPLNLTGNFWEVPIDRAIATVSVPGEIQRVLCFQGATNSKNPCTDATSEGAAGQATFSADHLGVEEGMSAWVSLPKGVVAKPEPILEAKWSLSRAFTLNPLTGSLAGIGALASSVGVAVLGWRSGRDRRYVGAATDQAFGGSAGDEPVPLFDKTPNPVEFVPPEKIRPGQMGTLFDEVANPVDVSATMIDLAVRGHLQIEEIPKEGLFGRRDFRLRKLDNPSDPLVKYEAKLYESLFASGSEVQLSELKTHFAEKLAAVQTELYRDVTDRGWFFGRPDNVRSKWLFSGLALVVVGAGVVYLAARFTRFGLVASVVPLTGLLLTATAHRMPARTAAGTAMLGRIRGFRELFEYGEGDRQKWAEAAGLFPTYLPYAIVFGCTEKWARILADLEAAGMVAAGSYGAWYVSPHPFDAYAFGGVVDDFSTSAAGTMAAAAATTSSGGSGWSGGGFSGGGFGGGGGGSW